MPKISNLPTTEFPSLEHEIPTSKEGETVKITVKQIRKLMQFAASEISAPNELTVEQVLTELASGKADRAYVDLQDNALGDAIEALAGATVRVDGPQVLTPDRQGQGRANISALGKLEMAADSALFEGKTPAQLPISTAVQTAVNGKFSTTGGIITGNTTLQKDSPKLAFLSQDGSKGYDILVNVGGGNDFGFVIQRYASAIVTIGAFGNALAAHGNVVVDGTLSAASKSFKTDHPLDPYNKNIVYASTESPGHGVEYWGSVQMVNGRAIVDVDAHYGMMAGTFQTMTADAVLFFQNQDSGKSVYRQWLEDGTFEIISDDLSCNDLIGWQVKGIRKDAVVFTLPNSDPITGHLIPEFDKPDYVEPEHA